MAQPSKPITVLHIDSDQAFLEVSKGILSMLGDFQVDSTLTAKQADQLLRERTYDVIISAYYLNDTNGIDYLNRLKLADIKSQFVLFTVHDETAEQALEAGLHFIGKYGDPETIFAKLCQILKSAKC
jgi:DNA-binding NarL/FixJ family response regulator